MKKRMKQVNTKKVVIHLLIYITIFSMFAGSVYYAWVAIQSYPRKKITYSIQKTKEQSKEHAVNTLNKTLTSWGKITYSLTPTIVKDNAQIPYSFATQFLYTPTTGVVYFELCDEPTNILPESHQVQTSHGPVWVKQLDDNRELILSHNEQCENVLMYVDLTKDKEKHTEVTGVFPMISSVPCYILEQAVVSLDDKNYEFAETSTEGCSVMIVIPKNSQKVNP